MARATETKLGAARTRLILERPFIGALVMHLPLVAADWCETVATDARSFYFNPGYIDSLSLAETQFVLAHEAMHCALGHFARRAHRAKAGWDIACDHAVNLMLIDEGLKSPRGALANRAYRGLSAEEIYPLIAPDAEEKPLDRHLFDAGTSSLAEPGSGRQAPRTPAEGDAASTASTPAADAWDDAGNEARSEGLRVAPPPVTPDDVQRLARQWQSRLAQAAQQARHSGRLGESWLRSIDALLEPQLPWRTLLARYLVNIARDDYSFQRLSRRGGDALLPSLASGEVNLVIALDTSGSIGERELREFAAEVDALKGQVRARVTLHACDCRLAADGPWTFESWQPIALPHTLSGGGGTSFKPVFDWVAGEHLRPDLLLYFTDAEGEFPAAAPPYPVLWLVKGRGEVPWGERIQLN